MSLGIQSRIQWDALADQRLELASGRHIGEDDIGCLRHHLLCPHLRYQMLDSCALLWHDHLDAFN